MRYCSDGNDWVAKASIKPILVELGAKESTLTDEMIDKLINTANLDGDDKIDFKEFLIAAAIGLFLPADEAGKSEAFLKVKQGFMVVKETFDAIDEDGSGQIDYDELKSAFLTMRSDELVCMLRPSVPLSASACLSVCRRSRRV